VGQIVGTREGPLVQLDQPVPGQIRLGPVSHPPLGDGLEHVQPFRAGLESLGAHGRECLGDGFAP
jgi:hypothetical protein